MMKYKKKSTTQLLFTLLILALIATGLFAKDDLNCLICHQFRGLARLRSDGTLRSFYVDPAKSEASVHSPLTCETCHDYIKQVPHLAENIRPVDCSNWCHLENNPALGEDFSHQKIKTAYTNSSHGPENKDTPRCNYCHPQHRMTRLTKAEPRFIVGLCASCHGDESLMKKHDKSAKPVVLYNQGVHRQANYYGNKKAAYCVNCHDPHRVLDYTNPESPTYKDNRVKICAQPDCHPKATATFANKGAIHNTYGDSLMGLITDYLPPIYVLIIVGTIGFMLFHNGLDFLGFVVRGREIHPKQQKDEIRYFTRLTLNERLQHLILLTSFITLVITGAMLKIPREWVLAFTNNLEKAYLVRWYLHRIAAVALASVSLYHIFYLIFTKRGNEQFRELVPGLKDLRDIGGTFKYYFGLAKHKPDYGHFDYKEKIEYWALIWGNFVMILTGSLIWFKIYVPKAFVDVSFIVHRYEAVLAVLAIIVWHFYAVHWKPGKFPMSMIWISGRISEEELIEEHANEYVKLTGKEPPRHDGEVKYSRTGPLISLILIIITSVVIYVQTPRIKQAFRRNMAIPVYQPPRPQLNEDLTPSNCQTCHGSFPHTKNVRLRAFANVHASKLYCETCHLTPKNSSQTVSYAWYNGGKLQEPDPDVMLSGQEALVSYVTENGVKRVLLMGKDSLDQKWRISLSGRACQVCHFGEGKYVIDFAELGYDKEQVYNLNNSKALGMLIKRKTFYFYAF